MADYAMTVAERLSAIPAFSMPEEQCLRTLCDSVYPDAKPESALMVLAYCKANVLDPFQKPVHIVSMRVKDGEKDDGSPKYKNRDVIMPGVGLYRTQAARTGQYAGVSEPEYGPMRSLTFQDKQWVENGERADGSKKWKPHYVEKSIEYPEWCKVTVRRLVGGQVAEFHAVEFWLENYATAGNDSDAPNAMWKKRPRGQLAKCTEAQALRKAFPEFGAQPTAEEMEGKSLDVDEIRVVNPEPTAPRARPLSKSEAAKQAAHDVDPTTGEITPPASEGPVDKPSPPASAGMLGLIRTKAKAKGLADDAAICAKFGLTELVGINVMIGNRVLSELQHG